MVKAIIFDCFGVLAADIWLEFCSSLPPEVDADQAIAMNKAYDKGIISYEDFRQGVFDLAGRYPPELEHMAAANMAKNSALIELIGTLKPNYKIGLMSNVSSDWITDEFLTATEKELFDDILLSYQVGFIKPDPRIYQAACDRLGVLPEEAVMVDDRQGNVDGALNVGLQGIVYENLSNFKAQLNALLNAKY